MYETPCLAGAAVPHACLPHAQEKAGKNGSPTASPACGISIDLCIEIFSGA
eukprot:SAG11_NODE_681_length_7772_cov_26.403362_11_plen_51_part_00